MTKTVNEWILLYLHFNGPMFKGELEDQIRKVTGSYGDTTARRLRELEAEGKIAKETVDKRTVYKIK